MSKTNWNRAIFFLAGTFFGGYVLSLVGGIFGKAQG